MTWWVRDATGWKDVTQPKIRVGTAWLPVARGLVYDGTTWKRFFPQTEITSTTISAGLTGTVPVAVARTVSGTVFTQFGVVSGGTVTVQQRLVGGTTWTNVGTSATLGTAASAPWSASVTPSICGDTEFKAVYSGSPTNATSESAVSAVTVIVNTPVQPTGGALANTTATVSWTAVAGATGYDVYRKGVTAANTAGTKIKVSTNQAGLSFSDTALTPNTDYEWSVIALRGTCASAESPIKKGHTGQTAVQDTGSATIDFRPEKTNSYRPDYGWGYIGEHIGQGYYSVSNRNYTGVIDYGTNAQMKAKVVVALGTNGATRYTNMTVSAARVFLQKQTGVGASGPITISFYNSTSDAGVESPAPVLQGTEVTAASSSGGAGDWESIGTAHWAALKAGTARSIALYDLATTNYARFDGKSVATNRCNLQLDCAWNYQLTAPVTPAWTP